jgi:hypothetical protein
VKGNKYISAFFFSNYFYGVCAVALGIEAMLQQEYPLNGIPFFVLLFCVTVLYYTRAYIQEKTEDTDNLRSLWYMRNHRIIWWNQVILGIISVVILTYYATLYASQLAGISLFEFLLLAVPVAVGILYYGVGSFNIRNIGWLKPFLIGFEWAVLVTIMPTLFYHLSHNSHMPLTLIGVLLFIKNMMFLTVLSIMFDIKDYAVDSNQQLKTFVVKVGLRKTIFYIIIPLSIIGLGTFLSYGFTHAFHPMKIALNTIPFILLVVLALSMQRRHSIFYYLVLIDGLILLKAICGMVAMIYF